jgi:hypothetical protein
MAINLNDCSPGDILISKGGAKFRYVGKDPGAAPLYMRAALQTYPHLLLDLDVYGETDGDPSYVTRLDDGRVYTDPSYDSQFDIVGYAHSQ